MLSVCLSHLFVIPNIAKWLWLLFYFFPFDLQFEWTFFNWEFISLFVVAALVIGKTIAARPAKIIAGHEADKTNELLQALAEAINKKVSMYSICSELVTYFLLSVDSVQWSLCM